MKLYIDTTNADNIMIGFDDQEFKSQARQEKSQKLLPFIVNKLKEHELTLDDIEHIEVNTGPGSYTGIRVGMSVAMTLGWMLNVPVNGKDIGKGEIPEINYD